MTTLFNDPTRFAEEMAAGFVAANARWAGAVNGGVVRSADIPEGQVAVIAGGGLGHYPGFAGMVGPGLLHGAAMGNIFAAPSASQCHSVASSAESGGGVLFCVINYAGDVMSFRQAAERLRAEGVQAETVIITDDVYSAPLDERQNRRGIAGALFVLKVAGAAAAAGLELAEVARLAALANDRSATIGVAFSGCTLPGADAPLFTVPAGKMAIGMGIHGEPGIAEADIPSAEGLAELMVGRLLEEAPVADLEGARIGVILNGLGAIKYEELFVLYRDIDRLLSAHGLVVVEPEVGEFVTSFDMAGVSLSLCWFEPELEALWAAACDSPGYSKGSVEPRPAGVGAGAGAAPARARAPRETSAASSAAVIAPAGDEGQRVAACVVAVLADIQLLLDENAEMLGRIDAVSGDGDHGIGMARGSSGALAAAKEAAAAGAGGGTVLRHAAAEWADRAGGTSGVLWSMILSTLGECLGDEQQPGASLLAAAVTEACRRVMDFGKAVPGDKTMVDAFVPLVEALQAAVERGEDLAGSWRTAAAAAKQAAEGTAAMLPRLGRARTHGERNVGTPDAGATSLAMIAAAVAEALNR